MTLVGGQMSIAKTNVFRSLVDQPLLAANTSPATVAASYCQNMVNIAPARDNLDMAKDAAFTSPVPAVGNNLATFLGNRLSMSFVNLGCANYGLTNPVNVTLDGNGVATAVTYSLTQQTAKGAAPAGTTTAATPPSGRAPNPAAGQTTGTQARGGRAHAVRQPVRHVTRRAADTAAQRGEHTHASPASARLGPASRSPRLAAQPV